MGKKIQINNLEDYIKSFRKYKSIKNFKIKINIVI